MPAEERVLVLGEDAGVRSSSSPEDDDAWQVWSAAGVPRNVFVATRGAAAIPSKHVAALRSAAGTGVFPSDRARFLAFVQQRINDNALHVTRHNGMISVEVDLSPEVVKARLDRKGEGSWSSDMTEREAWRVLTATADTSVSWDVALVYEFYGIGRDGMHFWERRTGACTEAVRGELQRNVDTYSGVDHAMAWGEHLDMPYAEVHELVAQLYRSILLPSSLRAWRRQGFTNEEAGRWSDAVVALPFPRVDAVLDHYGRGPQACRQLADLGVTPETLGGWGTFHRLLDTKKLSEVINVGRFDSMDDLQPWWDVYRANGHRTAHWEVLLEAHASGAPVEWYEQWVASQ